MKNTITKVLLMLVSVGLISVMGSAQGIWEQVRNAPVPGGNGQAVAATDEGVFIICQRCEITETRFFEFLPESENSLMRDTDNLPEAAFRDGSALVWDEDPNGYLYALLGSRTPAGGDLDRRLFFRYDLDRDRWEDLTRSPFPQGNGDAMVFTERDNYRRLYALLGSNLDRSEDLGLDSKSVLAIYDIEMQRWEEELIDLNESWIEDGTGSGASLVWDRFDKLYVLQGDASENSSGRFASFSLTTERWLDLADIPEASFLQGNCGVAAGGSLVYLGHIDEGQTNYIYALGGACHDGDPGYHVYRYVISTDDWEQLTDLPCPVGVYNGNRFFIFRDELYYSQSSPETSDYICGGDDIFRYVLP